MTRQGPPHKFQNIKAKAFGRKRLSEKDKKERFWKRFTRIFYEKKETPGHAFKKIGRMRVHDITDPKVMRAILRDMDNFHGVQFVTKTFNKLIGNALIMDEGESWKIMHDILAPRFSPPAVEKYIAPVALEECDAMVDRWIKQGQVKDVEREMRDMTGRIIMRAIFGKEVADKEGPQIIREISEAMSGAKQPRGFARIMRRLNVPYDHAGFIPPFLLRVIGRGHERAASVPRRFAEATARVDKMIYGIIEERRKLPQQPDDILGTLINAKKPGGAALTDSEIRDQALMIVVTGHETTAEGMTFAIMELLKHPAAQKPLRDEFGNVAAARPLSGRDFNRLPQAQAAFKEALRLHPTVYMSTREAKGKADFGDIHIEAHDIIRMDLRKLHGDPALWPDPRAYKPERFEKTKFPQAYMSFGTGPRVCLGINMASYEGALMLSQIFNRVDLSAEKLPAGDEYYFTTRPRGSMDVKVTARGPRQNPGAV